MNPEFNPQPELSSSTVHLRPLKLHDLEPLYSAARDPLIWEGHPVGNRHQREVFQPYAKWLLTSGTTLVIIDSGREKIIGCSRYYVSPDQPASISIGFTFLHRSYWGGATNFEVKRLMLDHAFKFFAEVWFHIAPANVRSQKATLKLGAEYMCDKEMNLSGSPALWKCFRLQRDTWEQIRHQRAKNGAVPVTRSQS